MFIGIDFGNSTSGAAFWDGRPKMIELSSGGSVTMPTVVCVADGEVLVGVEAMEKGRYYPDFDFRNFKRKLAEKWHDDEDTGFQTCEGPGGMMCLRGPGGFVYSPIELTSYILASIVAAANAFLAPDTVTGAVITVPAPFTPEQVAAVKEAARLAGIANVITLEEPIAAAIAHGVDTKRPRRIIVVDFGGSTLDLSCCATGSGHIRVIAKNGIGDLGGADFDKCIADYVINLWRTEHGKDLATNDAAMSRILAQAEIVKKKLSDKDEVEFRIENIDRTPEGVSQHMIYKINRKLFEEMTSELRKRVTFALEMLVKEIKREDPKFSLRDIHDVLLVGGMTRVPAIRELVTQFFGRQPRKDEAVELVVAQGAAIWAAIQEGRLPDITVADVLNFDVAIETRNNVPAVIISRNTPYPLEKPITLSNADDDQTELSVRLLYATQSRAEDCSVIQSEDLIIDPAPAETARIKMIVSVDEDGQPSIRRAA